MLQIMLAFMAQVFAATKNTSNLSSHTEKDKEWIKSLKDSIVHVSTERLGQTDSTAADILEFTNWPFWSILNATRRTFLGNTQRHRHGPEEPLFS
jgi:hypothetical protein